MSFSACDGTVEDSSSQGGLMNQSSSEASSSLDESAPEISDSSEIESVPEEESSIAEEVLPESSDSSEVESVQSTIGDSSQDEETNETDKLALDAAFDKSLQSIGNCTITETYSGTSNSWGDGEAWWSEAKTSSLMKFDGNKQEIQKTFIDKTSEGTFEESIWEFYQITSEDEEGKYGDYYYQGEDGEWKKESGEIYEDDDYLSMMDLAKLVYEQLEYDESTGIYSVTNYSIDYTNQVVREEWGTINGKAIATFRKVEIELKDGYIYRLFVDVENVVDVTIIDAATSTQNSYKENGNSTGTIIFSDYGTTVVNLPQAS